MSTISKRTFVRIISTRPIQRPILVGLLHQTHHQRHFSISDVHAAVKANATRTVIHQKVGKVLLENGYSVVYPDKIAAVFQRCGLTEGELHFKHFCVAITAFMEMRRTPPSLAKENAFCNVLSKGLSPQLPKNKHVYENREIIAEALTGLAYVLLMPPNVYYYHHMAEWALLYAIECDNYDAALGLWRLAKARQGAVINSKAFSTIKAAAVARADMDAMLLYVDHILSKPSNPVVREEAFLLARDLYEMAEPGNPSNDVHAFGPWPQPWELLMNAADQYSWDHKSTPNGPEFTAAKEAHELAIREGATKYNDPKACRLMTQFKEFEDVQQYSPLWLEMKTKSAMDGDADDCYALAKYWLHKHGWYPCKGKEPKDGMARLGLDWLGLAAANSLKSANKMGTRYLVGALILRENGQSAAGLSWVNTGIQALKDDLPDDALTRQAITKLSSFATDWNKPFGTRAESILGPPV